MIWHFTVEPIIRATIHGLGPALSNTGQYFVLAHSIYLLYIQLVTIPYTYSSPCSKLHTRLHSFILSTFVIKLLRQY